MTLPDSVYLWVLYNHLQNTTWSVQHQFYHKKLLENESVSLTKK